MGLEENLNLITINNSSAFRIANTDNREVTVAIKGGNFTSVSTALAYVTAQTPTDVAPWFIRVGPGSFTESNPLVIPKYVHVEGAGFATTHIIASNNSLNLFALGGSVIHISDFATHGPTLASAIFYTGDFTADFLRFTLIHRVDLNGCKHGVYLTNTTGVCACDLISVSNGGVGGNYDGTVTRSCITIDQATAEKDPDWQPFRTLREINPMPGKKPAPAFGQNAVLASGDGQTARLGDLLVNPASP